MEADWNVHMASSTGVSKLYQATPAKIREKTNTKVRSNKMDTSWDTLRMDSSLSYACWFTNAILKVKGALAFCPSLTQAGGEKVKQILQDTEEFAISLHICLIDSCNTANRVLEIEADVQETKALKDRKSGPKRTKTKRIALKYILQSTVVDCKYMCNKGNIIFTSASKVNMHKGLLVVTSM